MNANATTKLAGAPELLMPQALLPRTAERLAVQYRGIVSEQTIATNTEDAGADED